jgi:tyrosyl-tRNA synthetase
MLGRDFVQSRLGTDGSGISYAEFSYSLIQGYDFVHLNREHDVSLQLCGADQWGNSLAGVDLIRRLDNKEAHVFSTPLIINKATGAKFGKTEDGAIWLDPTKTSVYDFYQFWLNTSDVNVIDYLKTFTFLTLERIAELEVMLVADPSARMAQKELAKEVTTFVHGAEITKSVEIVTSILFGARVVADLKESEQDMLLSNAPHFKLEQDMSVIEVLVASGLATSNREARTFVESGAVSLGDTKIQSLETMIMLAVGELALLRRGKKNLVVLYRK